MPYKSEKQRAKFQQLEREGKISRETLQKWDKETGDEKLPKEAPRRSQSLIRRPRRDAK